MTFIDMFCGMGTVRMGFEQAGHECVYSIEWDKHKRKIYEVIFGNEPEASDICTVRGADLPISDCWCFGAPCQDFSIAGLRNGMEGDRSSLVREVFRLVRETPEEHRPEWLLYENVKGMLSSNKGLDYLEILFEVASLGYDIEYQLVNSKDFGVPQNRERVYTLGHLRTRGKRKVFPITGQSNKYSTVGKSAKTAVARTLTGGGHSGGNHSGMTILRWQNKKQGIVESDIAPALRASGGTDIRSRAYVKTLNTKDVNGKEPPQQDRVYAADGLMTALSAQLSGRYNIVEPIREPKIQCIGNLHGGKSQRGRIYSPDGISPSLCSHSDTGAGLEPKIIQTSHGFNSGGLKDIAPTLSRSSWENNNHLLQDDRIRRLTPRECMRLQGVSDYTTDKLIAAGISDTQLYRAAGDACTVNVIYEIAKAIGKCEKEVSNV